MSTATQQTIASLASQLLQAEANRQPIPCLTDQYPGLSLDEAYQIQLEVIRQKVGAGDPAIGKKAGFTSKAKQESMGVFEPILGHLTLSMMLSIEEPLQVDALIHPKVEPEIAFLLGENLVGPGVTAAHVLAATKAVFPALEVLDSRFQGFQFRAADVVADNASSARLVIGGRLVPPTAIDLRLVGAVYEKNGQVVATAAGAAVLGHPAAAVAWMANKLAGLGGSLRAGEIILAGALVSAVDVTAGDWVRVSFDGLGSLTLRCV